MCLDEMVPLEDHMEKVEVMDVFEFCHVCVYTFVCVEIITKRETVSLRMLETVQTILV